MNTINFSGYGQKKYRKPWFLTDGSIPKWSQYRRIPMAWHGDATNNIFGYNGYNPKNSRWIWESILCCWFKFYLDFLGQALKPIWTSYFGVNRSVTGCWTTPILVMVWKSEPGNGKPRFIYIYIHTYIQYLFLDEFPMFDFRRVDRLQIRFAPLHPTVWKSCSLWKLN